MIGIGKIPTDVLAGAAMGTVIAWRVWGMAGREETHGRMKDR